jgi:hypothetical protein
MNIGKGRSHTINIREENEVSQQQEMQQQKTAAKQPAKHLHNSDA